MMRCIGLRTIPYSCHKYYKYVQAPWSILGVGTQPYSLDDLSIFKQDSDKCDKDMIEALVCKWVLGDGM